MTAARHLCTDELLFWLGQGLRRQAFNEWEANFAKSVLGRARRKGPEWEPSQKERPIILRLVDSLEKPEPLVEDE